MKLPTGLLGGAATLAALASVSHASLFAPFAGSSTHASGRAAHLGHTLQDVAAGKVQTSPLHHDGRAVPLQRSVQGQAIAGPASVTPDNGQQVQQALQSLGMGITENTNSSAPQFSPINPPSIPLAVKGWYLNAWAPSGQLLSATPPNAVGNGGYLAGQWASFWTSGSGARGEFRLGWTGLIRVDNVTYQWMGNSFGTIVRAGQNARQLSATYTATRTLFAFEAGGVHFNVTFLTPITPSDYLRQSIPMSYLHVQLDRATAKGKKVQLYADVDERWITGYDYDYEEVPYTSMYIPQANGTSTYFMQRTNPTVYKEHRQRAEWGSVAWAARKRPGLVSRNQNNVVVQLEFLTNGTLTDGDHPPVGGPDNSFAYAVDLTKSTGKPADDEVLFGIGHFRSPYVSYIRAVPNSNGTRYTYEDRYGYWMSRFPAFQDALSFFMDDFESARQQAVKFDAMIERDAKAVVGGGQVGDQYAAIAALSVRQAFATLEFTVPYNQTTRQYDTSDTLVFLKEISSNGDCSTADVIFPMFPLLTYLNPDLLRLTLGPLMEYQAAGLYPNKWAAHDLGVSPVCTGHPDGNEEIMQVEESGNMIAMVLHYAQLVGAAKARPYLQKYYKLLAQWAQFLIADSLIPAEQLSTDDFAGTLANQTNLAIKGILGIGAMARIADMVGNATAAAQYRDTAKSYTAQWQKLAISNSSTALTPNVTHTVLAYNSGSSWGTLYNIYLNDLLNLGLLPQRVYDVGTNFLPRVVQTYGLPLDSRHFWSKSDWVVWMSTTVAPTVRDTLLGRLYKFYASGRVDLPMTDLYETRSGDVPKLPFDPRVTFMARPVVGGHFAHQALSRANSANNVTKPRYPLPSLPRLGFVPLEEQQQQGGKKGVAGVRVDKAPEPHVKEAQEVTDSRPKHNPPPVASSSSSSKAKPTDAENAQAKKKAQEEEAAAKKKQGEAKAGTTEMAPPGSAPPSGHGGQNPPQRGQPDSARQRTFAVKQKRAHVGDGLETDAHH